MKRILILFFALMLAVFATSSCSSTQSDAAQNDSVEVDNVQITESFIDAVHEFDELFPFSEGFAAVRKDDLFGYINTKGELVIPCRYEYAGPFKNGLACVVEGEDKSIIFIDKLGGTHQTNYTFGSQYYLGYHIKRLANGYIEPEIISFSKGICKIEYVGNDGDNEFKTVYIDKDLKETTAPEKEEEPSQDPSEYEIFTKISKDIYGDEIELKGLRKNTGEIVVPAKYNNLRFCDNGVILATFFIEAAESHLHPYIPYGLQIDGYIDLKGKSTFTQADLGKLDGYKEAQRPIYRNSMLEADELEEEIQIDQVGQGTANQIPEWIIGTWECKGTIDYGSYMGGVQRFTARAIITSTNIKVYYDGDLAYIGSYTIEGGEIKYNRKNGTCDVIPLDYSNKRLEFGDGHYYTKVSSNSNSSSASSSSYSTSFRSSNDVLSYTSGNSFYNSGDRLQIKFDAIYLNGRALTGAPRVTSVSGSSATVVANSPYGNGKDMHFYVNCANGTITNMGDVYRIR